MKGLVRKDKTYSLNNLPALKSGSFIWNEVRGYTGSVIKRPVKPFGIYSHYGLIYGFDKYDTLWVIENNIYGVECVTFRDFLAGHDSFTIEPVTNPEIIPTILKRAHERKNYPYNERTNNCDQFVNYCLTGKLESFQTEITEKIVDIVISLFEIRIFMSPDPKDRKLLKLINNFRNTIKLKRDPEFEKILNSPNE